MSNEVRNLELEMDARERGISDERLRSALAYLNRHAHGVHGFIAVKKLREQGMSLANASWLWKRWSTYQA